MLCIYAYISTHACARASTHTRARTCTHTYTHTHTNNLIQGPPSPLFISRHRHIATYIWMSHVTHVKCGMSHMDELCHTKHDVWCAQHTNGLCITRTHMQSSCLHSNGSCRTWMSHVSHEWVMSCMNAVAMISRLLGARRRGAEAAARQQGTSKWGGGDLWGGHPGVYLV